MSLLLNNIKLPISASEDMLPSLAAKALNISVNSIRNFKILRISIDARKKNSEGIYFVYTVSVELDDVKSEDKILSKKYSGVFRDKKEDIIELIPGAKKTNGRIVVVGLGPGGLFAAYMLAKYGYKPLVIERGKPISQRKNDVDIMNSKAILNENSNIMFGEGGAGTFSDGKLTTRIKDSRADIVIETFEKFGAPKGISLLAKPHVGTDVLTVVVENLRKEIQRLGGEIMFNTTLTDIGYIKSEIYSVKVLKENSIEEKIECDACILAIGQGARDTYKMLYKNGIELQAKPFAVGVRIEHPQELIDKSQYGEFAKHPRLGAAEYRLTGRTTGDRGVYTFCMCPGGVVVNSSSSHGQVVTNGMSYYARDGENSNGAVVVQVSPDDFGHEPLDGMIFQEKLEQDAFKLGGSDYSAPYMRVGDFINNRKPQKYGSVKPTYKPNIVEADIKKCLPDFISKGIYDGIKSFGRQIKGFDMDDAIITAVESRTSSPVRIVRDTTMQSVTVKGLYPVGEGAGYAGGIVSAAVDGIKAAERVISTFSPIK